jgi:hypothetical protein
MLPSVAAQLAQAAISRYSSLPTSDDPMSMLCDISISLPPELSLPPECG